MTRRQRAQNAIVHNPIWTIYTTVVTVVAILGAITQIDEAYFWFHRLWVMYAPFMAFAFGVVLLGLVVVLCVRIKIHSTNDKTVQDRLFGLERLMRKVCKKLEIDPDEED